MRQSTLLRPDVIRAIPLAFAASTHSMSSCGNCSAAGTPVGAADAHQRRVAAAQPHEDGAALAR